MTPHRLRVLIFSMIFTGIVIAGLFGWRSLHAFREFRGDRPEPAFSADSQQMQTDVELIRDWMTIPFVAKMYKVSRPVLYKALDISPQGNQGKSLKQLNEEYFPEAPGIVETRVKAAVLENSQLPAPTPPTLPAP